MTDPSRLIPDLTPVVNAIIRVTSKPYVEFIEMLHASGRISDLEVDGLNRDVSNQRLILVDLAKEELMKALDKHPGAAGGDLPG